MNIQKYSVALLLACSFNVCHADKEDVQGLQPAVDHDWYVVKKDDIVILRPTPKMKKAKVFAPLK